MKLFLPLYRLLNGNKTRLQELVGSTMDLSADSDFGHSVSQLLPREWKGVPAFSSNNFESTLRFRFTDKPSSEDSSKNKFAFIFPALFLPLTKNGSVQVFSNVSEIWQFVVTFAGFLDQLLGPGHSFYRLLFEPLSLALIESGEISLKSAETRFIVHLVSGKLMAFGNLLREDSIKDFKTEDRLCKEVFVRRCPGRIDSLCYFEG
jgi:hypothetical protein